MTTPSSVTFNYREGRTAWFSEFPRLLLRVSRTALSTCRFRLRRACRLSPLQSVDAKCYWQHHTETAMKLPNRTTTFALRGTASCAWRRAHLSHNSRALGENPEGAGLEPRVTDRP